MLRATFLISAAVVVILSAFVATAQVPVLAGVAELKDASGKPVGRATFIANLPEGGVWIQVQAEGLAPGVHGIHIHAVGVCSPPDFMTAGDHFNPENRKHGFLAGQSKLQEVLNRKTLIVGTGSTNPPWHFEDAQGNLVGMDIDLARLVARQLLTEAKFR